MKHYFLLILRFGKQRAKSTDAMRSSGRKTPTPETGIPSTHQQNLDNMGRRDEEARERMMNEQAKIQQHYKRLLQQQQQEAAESAAIIAAVDRRQHLGSGDSSDKTDMIYTGESSMPPPALPPPQSRGESALPASLAAARPGSRSGITGTPTDPRFANYEEIQRHLNRRQAQYHSQVNIKKT